MEKLRFWFWIAVLGHLVVGPCLIIYGLGPCSRNMTVMGLGLFFWAIVPIIALVFMVFSDEPEQTDNRRVE